MNFCYYEKLKHLLIHEFLLHNNTTNNNTNNNYCCCHGDSLEMEAMTEVISKLI